MTEPVERSDELPQAAKDNDPAPVTRLLESGVGVDTVDREGRTAWGLAVREGNAGPSHELTPMTEAAMFGRAAVAEVLIDAGVSMGARTARIPCVPPVLAAALGHTDVVELLPDRGADIEDRDLEDRDLEDRDLEGRSPLEWTASFGQAAVRLLLGRGAEPTARALTDASAERRPERAGDHARVLDAPHAAGAAVTGPGARPGGCRSPRP
ncbi:ankyrin repeat domain-containing protein [Streptomyces sp. YIM B13518]|uniref:ankyrin repeat domain-containing protein n=1 Tax=Streptomyces sp. YIM B13518 TaxID=3366316 RepID=UPI00368B21D6